MAETFATDDGTHTAAALVADALRWYTDRATVPELSSIVATDELRRTYRANRGGGHYFDPDTLRYFGVRSFTLAAPGVSVECQGNAPEGVGRYRVTAWTWQDGDLSPQSVATCHTLAAAKRLARAVPAAWQAYAATYAHAYDAGHRAGVRTLAATGRDVAGMVDSLTAARDTLAASLDGEGVAR